MAEAPSRAVRTLPPQPGALLAVDCGSTTTKAVLLLRDGGRWRVAGRAEAPTTVEAPFADVTVGLAGAVRALEEATGRRLWDGGRVLVPAAGQGGGVDAVLATSSAGGGLVMAVAGVVGALTAQTARRAALGAGAIVAEVLAVDDGRLPHERMDRLRELRPDIVLISGGVDGGNVTHVAGMGEVYSLAGARPRFDPEGAVPLVFAGNPEARETVARMIPEPGRFRAVENVRPRLEEEHVEPAREAIQELFLEHVMAHAPNLRGLADGMSAAVAPTPGAFGRAVERFAADWAAGAAGAEAAAGRAAHPAPAEPTPEGLGPDVLALDVGGATTDVFTVHGGALYRSVAANLGLSYSAANVIAEAGLDAVLRWLPFDADPVAVKDWAANKSVRPVGIPETWEELFLEHAVAREAIRLAVERHGTVAVGLRGVQQQRDLSNVFDQPLTGRKLYDPARLGAIVGSGGVLSHAPRRAQAALVLLDACQPLGVAELYVDRAFLLPHAGVLAPHYPEAARDVLYGDALVRLGTVVAPWEDGRTGRAGRSPLPRVWPGVALLQATIRTGTGREERVALAPGQFLPIPLDGDEVAECELVPAAGVDVGGGRGAPRTVRVRGGVLGLIFDGRGRPVSLPVDAAARKALLLGWFRAMGAYPAEALAPGRLSGASGKAGSGAPGGRAR